jgi:hypothetical protein
MNNKFILLATLATMLVACTPSEAKIMTAIAQTEAANPTATNTITPDPTATQTLTPSATPTITLTNTATATNTPTSTATPDMRVIAEDPSEFLLDQQDLPLEGKYYTPNSTWTSLQTNEEIISNRGVKEGREYVINTGRVVGWFAYRQRGTRTVRMPDEAGCGVYLYKTMAGAELALEKYIDNIYNSPFAGWVLLERNIDGLGGAYKVYTKHKIAPGGEKNTDIEIHFIYRNVAVNCNGWAYNEDDVTLEFVENMARKTYEKLKAAPLVLPEQAEAIFIQYQ